MIHCHNGTLRKLVVHWKVKHLESQLLHSLMLFTLSTTWEAEFLILFTLCSIGSKEAQDLHTEGPGEEHWSHPGAQWVFGAVSVCYKGGISHPFSSSPQIFILIKNEPAFKSAGMIWA